jgi:hypothetical protein
MEWHEIYNQFVRKIDCALKPYALYQCMAALIQNKFVSWNNKHQSVCLPSCLKSTSIQKKDAIMRIVKGEWTVTCTFLYHPWTGSIKLSPQYFQFCHFERSLWILFFYILTLTLLHNILNGLVHLSICKKKTDMVNFKINNDWI